VTERADLVQSIAETVADYRDGELPRPTGAHVDRWVRQFPHDAQVPILREFDHVLKQTYFSRGAIKEFLEALVTAEKIVGPTPNVFWKGASLLDIQQNGRSQADMLELFDLALSSSCGLTASECTGTEPRFIYLDDVMFSGSRIGNDLTAWLTSEAPSDADVHVIVAAAHTLGEYLCKKRLKEAAEVAGKDIRFHFWATRWFESRKARRDESDLLWPTEIPNDPMVKAYVALPTKFPFEPRSPGGPSGIFSSEDGRQVLEREFLIAGARIRAAYSNPSANLRPLGFSPFGVGFGSLVVTYRNCPNNAPLALWWGLGDEGDPESWYPLFGRKTYS
jgi:hypothetical protein